MWIENEKANECFVKHTILELEGKHKSNAGIVVGAGYGFREDVRKIYESGKKKLKLVATDKAFPDCCQIVDNGYYHPDYVVSLNTAKTEDVKLDEWYKYAQWGSKLILPVTAHPSHVRDWLRAGGGDNDIFWMVPANIDTDLSDSFAQKYKCPAIPRGANAGEFGFVVAFILGCDPIGLIGMPYAYKSLPEVLNKQNPENYEYHHFCTEGKHCFTSLGFMEQRTEFLELVGMTTANVYNVSEGGILYDNHLVKRASLDFFLEMCR